MRKVLIANRGEIAIRILRTVRESGMSPVAVYSEADQNALHVRMADEAYLLGPSPPSESYLSIERLIDVAKKSKADAVHPGYGFLSENAPFAKALENEKIRFIGPSSKAIAAMGDKIEARAIARKAGLSMTPASGPLKDVADATAEAKKIGYPVLLKAKAGGGGKGMRRAQSEKELQEAFSLAESEALKAFKNGTLYLEKYIEKPRHVEVQVFGDENGNVVSIGDRECSIQRRHQKIIEEAPAPRLSAQTKAAMAEAAIKVTKAVDYVGAGTIEFLVDDKENFFFLEMNTRLQVEHPVTEWISGLDLVAWQLSVAEGRPLPLSQDQIQLSGHALEARLYAEDPANRFFPSPGIIETLAWPNGPGTRVDAGVEAGSEVSLFYDPMLAKISTWGEDRSHALTRLIRSLAEVRISGIKTNLQFLMQILSHPRFEQGKLTTTFIQEEGPFDWNEIDPLELDAALAAILLHTRHTLRTAEKKYSPSAWWLSGLPRPPERRR